MQKKDNLYKRNGKLVYIKQPEYKELVFTSKLWASEETMKDIGGVYNFTENKWDSFYKKMVYPTDRKNFYCLIYNLKDEPVGEVSFHGYDPITKIARSNIKIFYKYRKNGYAEEAMKLMLEYYFFDFEGEIMMDNVKNEEGKIFASKVGFKEVRQYKEEITYKLDKNNFLNLRDNKIKTVSIIMYDQMDITNYTLICNILNKANSLANKKIFNIQTIHTLNNITCSNNLKFELPTIQDELLNPNIIILPDAKNIEYIFKNNKIIEYILKHYNDCDYICAVGEAIKFLIKTNSLNGMLVPDIDDIHTLIKSNNLNTTKVINKSFVDNGKVMISSNLMGIIEMSLSIILKTSGKELMDKTKEKLGFI